MRFSVILFLVLRSFYYLVLEGLCEASEIVAVSSYTDDEVAVGVGVRLGVEERGSVNRVYLHFYSAALDKSSYYAYERIFFAAVENTFVKLYIDNHSA